MEKTTAWISNIRNSVYLCGVILLMYCCLVHSDRVFQYASDGLNIWFQRMLPSLLPFMIICGILIRMNLSAPFAGIFSWVMRPLFRLSDSCIYVIVTGFLCGFPMGARVISESLRYGKISRREAELLLAFCNNIGPAYVSGFVAAHFNAASIWECMGVIYLIPLFYGLFLRYSFFRDVSDSGTESPVDSKYSEREINRQSKNIFSAIQDSIVSSLVSQASLGGNMIFYNMLKIVIDLLLPFRFTELKNCMSCLIEISGGLSSLGTDQIELAFVFLQFGGLCCFAQTYSMIQDTGLKLSNYVFHKTIQALLTFAFFKIII